MKSRLDRITDLEDFAEHASYRVKEIARKGGVSRRQLPRFFSEKFGCSSQHWLQNLQLRLAKELLVQREPGKAIASKLGFNHESSFYAFFRRATGMTPRTYAKAHVMNNIKPVSHCRLRNTVLPG